jgi:hypothetical protein
MLSGYFCNFTNFKFYTKSFKTAVFSQRWTVFGDKISTSSFEFKDVIKIRSKLKSIQKFINSAVKQIISFEWNLNMEKINLKNFPIQTRKV